MQDVIVSILRVLAPVSVGLIIFAQGLSISPSLVVRYFKQRSGVMVVSLLAAIVIVPAVTLALILLLAPARDIGIALAILVACPSAPLMLSAAPQKGGASAPFMASLHLSLAVLAFATVPAVLFLLSIPLGFHAGVDLGVMAWILARTIVLPIGLGLIVRAAFTELADRIGPVLAKVGTIGLMVVVLFGAVAFFPALLNTAPWSYLVIAAVSATALAIGQVLGPTNPHEKTTLAVECGVRHPALALTIASMNFTPERMMPVLVPCVIVFIALAMVYMFWRARSYVEVRG